MAAESLARLWLCAWEQGWLTESIVHSPEGPWSWEELEERNDIWSKGIYGCQHGNGSWCATCWGYVPGTSVWREQHHSGVSPLPGPFTKVVLWKNGVGEEVWPTSGERYVA